MTQTQGSAAAALQVGVEHHRAGRLPQAEAQYRQVLEAEPNNADALHLMGLIAHQVGKTEIAIQLISHAIDIRPSAQMHYNLGVSFQASGQLEAAIESYRRSLQMQPADAKVLGNLGTALYLQGNLAAAEQSFRKASEIDPNDAALHTNLGVLLQVRGRLDGAVESFRRSLALKPDDVEAHNNLGVALLTLGDLGAGWREYEWRVSSQSGGRYLADPRDSSRVLPRPSTLLPFEWHGRRILLLREQGLGDEVFFLRFAELARQRGAWVSYLPSAKMEPLVRRAPGLDAVVKEGTLPESLDQVFLVGELPLALGIGRLEDLPPPLPLTALPSNRSAMRARLAALGRGPYVGVTWRAGTEKKAGQTKLQLFKSADCAEVGRALESWPGQVLILQRHPKPEEVASFAAALGRPAHDLSDVNENLEDMLALLAEIDEYVGVSNTNMHLMASLGRKARVLVQNPPEWRWLTQGDASPWFPEFKVYRQGLDGSWSRPLAQLTQDLRR